MIRYKTAAAVYLRLAQCRKVDARSQLAVTAASRSIRNARLRALGGGGSEFKPFQRLAVGCVQVR